MPIVAHLANQKYFLCGNLYLRLYHRLYHGIYKFIKKNYKSELTNLFTMTIIIVVMRRQKFQIVYDPEVKDHLKAIEHRHYSLIRNTIEEQLTYQPDVETRNRKPLRRLSILGKAGEVWELRFGPASQFRVFYKFELETFQVFILAIGVKKDNQLIVGGEVFQL